jgi:DNA/RNA endonuclease YhcR with UshA esterase domain
VEKEEKIVVVLLLMTTLSLAVAYVTIFPNTINQKIYKPLSQETDIGEVATVEGTVYDKSMTRTGDHLVLTIDYNAWLITVFVPANSGAEEINNMVVEGDVLRITGELEEYKGERELIVENKDDVVVLQPS